MKTIDKTRAPKRHAGSKHALLALIAVADKATQLRIRSVLDPSEFTVTAATEPPLTLESAAEVCRDLKRAPDVVVLAGGRELFSAGGSVEMLTTLLPESRLVVVAPSDDRDLICRALRAGVCAVIGEARLESSLGCVLRAVRAGQLCLPPSLTRRIDARAFSQRERQVLEFVTRGLTNQQIAARLFLSESTVKSHLATSFRKLGLCSRAEAAAAWAEVLDDELEQRAMLERIAAHERSAAVVQLSRRPVQTRFGLLAAAS